jgi:predicted GNAT superfamily acetyltransferase
MQGAGVPPLGAIQAGEIVGFVLGFVGAGPDGIHLHSHMLAVNPGRQARGIGRALKLAQRAWALDRGLETMRWTFDPLIARNAHFNLNVLGAVADRFHRHYYGDMADRINRGEQTDRLEVVWHLSPDRASAAGQVVDRVKIPPDHVSLRRDDPAAAADWRARVADRLEEALAGGLAIGGFDRTGSAYLLTRGSNS